MWLPVYIAIINKKISASEEILTHLVMQEVFWTYDIGWCHQVRMSIAKNILVKALEQNFKLKNDQLKLRGIPKSRKASYFSIYLLVLKTNSLIETSDLGIFDLIVRYFPENN